MSYDAAMSSRRIALIACLCVATLVAENAYVSLAHAQSSGGEIVVAQEERRGGIFRFLTRPFRRDAPQQAAPQQAAPEQARPRRRQQQEAAQPRRQRQSNQPQQAAAPPPPPEIAKAEDAKRVLVVGDFMAGSLFKGLVEAYAENANVVVVDASNGSSGLVRDDYYNWPGELPAIIEANKPAAILMLIGANDRQSISGAGDPGSDPWRVAYAERVGAVADILKASTIPTLWAGLPPVNSGNMSRDYSAFNGIVREQLESRGLRFIETWDGFADAEGKFVASGPDITGQTVQLRTGDLGLNFTRAGQRKLAFFVEQELNAILGGAAPVLAAIDPAATGEIAGPPIPGEPPPPQIGPMVNIDTLTAGDALSGPSGEAASGTAAATILRRLSSGEQPPAGRADNFSWPISSTP